MTHGSGLNDVHPAVERTINEADAEGFVALYAPDARMVLPDGSTITGHEAIREQVTELLAMKGRMTVTTRYVIEAGGGALRGNQWTVTARCGALGAGAAPAAQGPPDGRGRSTTA